MTKKQKKAVNNKQRNFWPVSPVTRVVPDKKKERKGEWKKDIRRYC